METKPYLTLEDCRNIATLAEAEARKSQLHVSLAIVDDGGHVLLLARMDRAAPVTAEVAIQKSRSAAISRRSTKFFEDLIAAGRLALLTMPMLPVQGGVPIVVGDDCVGAIGVAGAHSHEDERICLAGLAAIS